MRKSEEKKRLVEQLETLHNAVDFAQLYPLPRQRITRNWLNDVASILKYLDEGDYQEFVDLSKGMKPTESREKRKEAADEIGSFVGRKVAEYKRYDFSYLDDRGSKNYWNFVNPLWLGYKLLLFLRNHKVLSLALVILTLLGIDYSLAWKNTLWIIGRILARL